LLGSGRESSGETLRKEKRGEERIRKEKEMWTVNGKEGKKKGFVGK